MSYEGYFFSPLALLFIKAIPPRNDVYLQYLSPIGVHSQSDTYG